MKKLISVVFICLFMLSGMVSYADTAGHIYKTDIKAYENYLQIPSYNCGGTTVIFARDLENYGYDILWDSEAKRVEITKNPLKEIHPMLPLADDGTKVGTILFDIYETDIKTYFKGKLIPSYNIGGKTAITLRSLEPLGSVTFNSKEKTALLLSRSLNLSSKEKEHINYVYEILDIMATLEKDMEEAEKMALEKNFNKQVMEKLNLSSLALSEEMEALMDYTEPSAFSESTMELWWAMVNLDSAANIIKASWNIYDEEYREKYGQYIEDSLAQKKNTLALLAGEF